MRRGQEKNLQSTVNLRHSDCSVASETYAETDFLVRYAAAPELDCLQNRLTDFFPDPIRTLDESMVVGEYRASCLLNVMICVGRIVRSAEQFSGCLLCRVQLTHQLA